MITPEQLAASGTEHGNQAALFCWAALNWQTYPELSYMFAIPNGGFRNPATAGRLKAEGVKPGVPDIFLPVAKGETIGHVWHVWHGLFIEMKREKGVLSANQKDWRGYLHNHDYKIAVCHGWEAARHELIHYLRG